jgi:DNA-binding IclR family transcriptional regulator
LEKRRAFLNLVEKLGYRQLTEDEEVFLTSCPDVREYGYFIWDEESDNYLFDAYVEVHVRDGDGEVLAITLTLTTRKLTPEAKEWLEVKQYVLYEHENFRELVRKFLEQVEKEAGKPKPDQ